MKLIEYLKVVVALLSFAIFTEFCISVVYISFQLLLKYKADFVRSFKERRFRIRLSKKELPFKPVKGELINVARVLLYTAYTVVISYVFIDGDTRISFYLFTVILYVFVPTFLGNGIFRYPIALCLRCVDIALLLLSSLIFYPVMVLNTVHIKAVNVTSMIAKRIKNTLKLQKISK